MTLAGRRIVVTRTTDQASRLVERLRALGAEPVEVPLLVVAPPADGGAALRVALAGAGGADWLVVTSPNGADAVLAELADRTAPWPRLAVVGPATAQRLEAAGHRVDLVPERFVAEGLLAVFPSPAAGEQGRVVLAQAPAARDVLAVGLRGLGWRVEQVEAYRTEAAPIAPGARAAVASADAVTFTSASTVTHFVAAFGADAAPPVVVCIGPVTADAAVAAGLRVGATAAPHTIDGLVDAIAAVFGP